MLNVVSKLSGSQRWLAALGVSGLMVVGVAAVLVLTATPVYACPADGGSSGGGFWDWIFSWR
tara:strand:+ start:20580 stop:20765 length:186 start_codon:yes stop_codon:yes gene_type:complete